jgi:hypothetical protein
VQDTAAPNKNKKAAAKGHAATREKIVVKNEPAVFANKKIIPISVEAETKPANIAQATPVAAPAVDAGPVERVVFFAAFIECLGLVSIAPLLPEYVFSRGKTTAWVGAIYFIQSSMSILGAPLMGGFADRFGPKGGLLFTILVDALLFLASGFVDSVEVLFILRGIAGGVIVLPSCQAYIAELVPPHQRRSVITRWAECSKE